MTHARTWIAATLLCLVAYVPAALSEKEGDDAGESKAAMALKGRDQAPQPADIDTKAGLASLVKKNGPKDWSSDKAATVMGTVVKVDHEPDGDYHIVMAPKGGESDSKKWVIVEVTPAWSKKVPALAPDKLEALKGQQIKATGWLFYEPEDDRNDPRGTRWEVHPVTNIVAVDQPAMEKK